VSTASLIVAWFAKTGLVHAKWQGTLFTATQYSYTNELMIHVCIVANGSLVCFICLMCSSVQVIFKWQWCDWTNIHPLEIATQLTSELGHQIGYYLWYLELKWTSDETICSVRLVQVKKAATLWLPTTPDLHPYVITCDTGIKISAIQLVAPCSVGQLKEIV